MIFLKVVLFLFFSCNGVWCSVVELFIGVWL